MEFPSVRFLSAPNIWGRLPVFQVDVDLEAWQSGSSEDFGRCSRRLLAWLAALPRQRCSDSADGDGMQPFADPRNLALALGQLVLELQCLAGSPVRFCLACESCQPDCYQIIIEYEEEPLARACLEVARDLLLAAAHDRPYDLPDQLRQLRGLALDVRLGPSTGAIVRAARQRSIPVRRLNSRSLVQLGHGARQRRICTAETDRTTALGEAIAQDKELTRAVLRAAGIPVPEGRPVADAEDAWEAAEELGPPVVVKPQDGNHGRGVATNLKTREQVLHAYAAARAESSRVLVERYAPGVDYRLLVVGERMIAAALRAPAQVVGDGRSTIAELVKEVNRDPRRSDGHATALSWINLDAVALAVLREQGYTPESIAEDGRRVLIRRNGNLSTGGTATDVTDQVHPEVARQAVEAARVIGLDIAGVDVVALDIGRPLEAQRGVVVEVNAGPGLRMHLEPSSGQPRPVGEAIVSLLFAEGQTGRIPIVAVSGGVGASPTAQWIADVLRGTNGLVGLACRAGTYLNGRCLGPGAGHGRRSSRAILLNPRVETAVLEVSRESVLQEGLEFDRCDVAVMLESGEPNHRGSREFLETTVQAARTVLETVAPTGVAVLNAEVPWLADLAPRCAGAVIYFALDSTHPTLAAHRQTGGRVVFWRDQALMLAEGEWEQPVMDLTRIPLPQQSPLVRHLQTILATVAVAWFLAMPLDLLQGQLQALVADVCQTLPARVSGESDPQPMACPGVPWTA